MPNDNSANRSFDQTYWRTSSMVDQALSDLTAETIDDRQFRLLADHVPTLCWMANGDGYIVWYNRRWHEYCGTTPAEMEGWGWESVHDPEVLPSVMERWQSSIATGEPFEMIFPLKGADGEFRPFLTRVQPLRDSTGNVVRWFGVNADISETVAAEQALRESEHRLRLVQAAGNIGSFDYDLRTEVAVCSPEYFRIMGLPEDSVVTLESAKEIVHPQDLERAVGALERAIAEQTPLHSEYRIIRPDNGEVRWIANSALLIFDDNGTPWRYVGGIVDITGRISATSALSRSESRLRAVLDSAPGGFYCVDTEGNTTLVSRGFLDMMGFDSEADVIGKKLHDAIHHTYPDGRHYPVEECPIYQCASTGQPAHIAEELFFKQDGTAVPVEYWVSAIRQDGRDVGAICTILDLTQRKAMEAAHRETEERYRLAARATNDAIWDWDLINNQVLWNEALYTVFGYTPEQVSPTGDWWIENIHPDEREAVSHAIHEVIDSGGLHWQAEYRFRSADGSYRHVLDRGFVLRDNAGAAIRMIGAMLDQTARLQAELEVRSQAHIVETINRTGEAIAGELALEKVVQIVTDAAVELTGAQFGAFFYNVIDNSGEKLLLYSLSGAEREDFERFGMPRATAVFHPTFVGEGVVRSDDIKLDPRYGKNEPHNGMPKGHLPVTSYLAVPVQSRSGEVIGGLFLGHPEAARFSEQHEQLIVGVAAQAAIAIDNARLYEAANQEIEERKRAEVALTQLNATLEERVESALAERKLAEEALRQAQKMEAVGQLTGGIAHDFNNLLTVVTGNIDMAARALQASGTQDPRAQRALENAMKGAERAASLTQRLLAFSRRQPLAPKALDMDRLVTGMSDLLNRALGETIKLEIVTSPGLWRVEADPNQLESAILNLAVNARDAMPGGGELVVETANARLDEEYCAAHAEVAPGQYVVIAVTDTGEGMPRHIQERVFEPFYTTKDPGKGTGLGLSMVYGFVKQSGGHIKIYSEEGQGTTIKIYLPRLLSDAAAEDERDDPVGIEASASAETILVVEDDDDVRTYSVECLRELGYRVLEAHDGPSALRLLQRQSEPVDLLFTDVVMPGMSGRELADAAREHQSSLRVLFTSGYTRNAIVHGGRLDAGVDMIPKPFTYAALAQRIRDALDSGRTGRVLVVEDEPTVRSLAMELLISGGYGVDEAGNATEALGKIRSSQGRYDIVFVADTLSDNPGEWLIAELRELYADMPVLLATRDDETQLLKKFKGDRCTGVIVKPYTGTMVLEALARLGVRCRKQPKADKAEG